MLQLRPRRFVRRMGHGVTAPDPVRPSWSDGNGSIRWHAMCCSVSRMRASMRSATDPRRAKVLRAERKHRHRYELFRAGSQAFTLAALVSVPLAGLARVDLWRGNHHLLLAPAPFKQALAGVILGIAASYVLTFLSNVAAGRMFCGWGCPVAQVSRFSEAAALDTTARGRLLAHAAGAAYSTAVVVALLAWWTDLRVLVAGSTAALAASWGAVALGTGAAFAHGRYLRWAFCKTACPIGLYYTVVSPARWYGVHFRDAPNLCIECKACDKVCPVGLAPRDLWAPVLARGGISVADAPGRNHCLECGDCVRGCEMVLQKRGPAPVPLRLGYFAGPQRETAPTPFETHTIGIVAHEPALRFADGARD